MKHTYKNAGVDKEAGYHTVENIKSATKATHHANVLNGIGDFAALYALGQYKQPVLVSGTDGVGTKIILAKTYDQWDDIGTDCFAMCANDVLCHGAKPLFFLDYIACGRLDVHTATRIVTGLARVCKENDTSLVGGETAEMPGVYQGGDYDIAGFCVGVVERDHIINGKRSIEQGNVVIGIASSGLHSNGFSLVRHLIKDYEQEVGGKKLYQLLLTPTKVYVNAVLSVLNRFAGEVKGMAHITGGGVIENIPRILPPHLTVSIDTRSIPSQAVFEYIQQQNIDPKECWGTFNMGVGFTLVVAKESATGIIQHLHSLGENAFVMGDICEQQDQEPITLIF